MLVSHGIRVAEDECIQGPVARLVDYVSLRMNFTGLTLNTMKVTDIVETIF
jgi:hypothetical protein